MERPQLISKSVFLLMICQTVTNTLNTSATYTSTKDGHGFVPSTIVPATLTEPWPSDTALQTSQSPTADHNSSFLRDGDQPLSSTVSTLHDMILTDRTGMIAMTANPEHFTEWVWTIHLPSPRDGLVMQFNHFCAGSLFYLTVSSMQSDSSLVTEWSSQNNKFHPLLVKNNEVKIVLDSGILPKHTLCRLNITYVSHPIEKMPREIQSTVITELYYNCSGDVLIPSVFRCNMVQECVDNEDENDCDYTHQGCGDWVPYRDTCLKVAVLRPYDHYRESYSKYFKAAEKTCARRYGALLAWLKDSADVAFVGGIMRQAGLQLAAIGLKKVKPVSRRLRHLYRFLWQWDDKGGPIEYLQQDLLHNGLLAHCSWLEVTFTNMKLVAEKSLRILISIPLHGYICMKLRHFHNDVRAEGTPLPVYLSRPSRQITQFPTRTCADGSLVQTFHLCYQESKQDMMTWSSYNFALFPCRYGPPVHYTVVCDGNDDCHDRSDETDCAAGSFPPLRDSMFICKRFQLIPKLQQCDGKYDCFDESDENLCEYCNQNTLCSTHGCFPENYKDFKSSFCSIGFNVIETMSKSPKCPCVVTLDGFGISFLQSANDTNTEGTVRCTDGDYYIPSFLLNNGEQDCRSGEDENIPLQNLTCPGFYRCFISKNCVHPDHVCDGIYHCPHKDDERYCDIVCPDQCQCEGYAFSCRHFSNFSKVLLARYLDISGSLNIPLNDIHFLELLRFLNLSQCNLTMVCMRPLPQLQNLDLSFNRLKDIYSFGFEGLSGLIYLNVSNNPLVQVLDTFFDTLIKLSGSNRLKSLVMRHTGIQSVKNRAFSPLTRLEILDFKNSVIGSYDRGVFSGLDSLQELYTDDSKLCCPYFHESRTINCMAPFDELSSCDDLLRLNFFRVFLWLIALLAIVGNACVVLYRLYAAKRNTVSTFRVLIINLCAADLSMGIYMTMIGIADSQLKGEYVAKENVWKRSIMCKMAGFLGFVSSEASAMTVCLITLDRMLVLSFPLKSHVHLTARSCLVACGVLWFVAMTLAAVPLTAGLEFYGVSNICLPLPITRRQFSGQFYSFGVFIIFNFVLFALIGLGQILIYRSILNASKMISADRKSQEMAIARRLFLVILSDFCCWFPVGLIGLLAAGGTPVSDEVNVWTAIFVLPLNSALNPFLYTLQNVLEKWRAEKIKRQTEKVLSNFQTHLPKLPVSTVEDLLKICIRSGVVKREKILQMLHVSQVSIVINPVLEVDSQAAPSTSPQNAHEYKL